MPVPAASRVWAGAVDAGATGNSSSPTEHNRLKHAGAVGCTAVLGPSTALLTITMLTGFWLLQCNGRV